jgi:uncharacterized MAPEG superfamily protein
MGAQVPVEMKLLIAAVIIGFVQIVWAAVAGAGGERDFAWLAGPRDDTKPVGVVAARLDRALKNFLETFPLFAAALLACAAVGKLGSTHTIYGSAAYVIGRALYVPLYALGTPLLRTIVWTVSILGIVAIIIAFFH